MRCRLGLHAWQTTSEWLSQNSLHMRREQTCASCGRTRRQWRSWVCGWATEKRA